MTIIAIVSIAGESDIVITTTENTVYLCSGEESTLTVFANDPTGEITDFRYQWFYNETQIPTTDDGWTEIDGENNSTLSLENILAETSVRNAVYYYCKVYFGLNYTSTSNSERFVVEVKMSPTVENQPQNAFVCENGSTQVSTNIIGYEPLSYTWLQSVDIDSDFTDITSSNCSGIYTYALSLSSASEDNERYYYCMATNECGSVRTDTIYISVTQQISIYPSLASSYSFCSGIDTAIRLDNSIYVSSTLVIPEDYETEGITFAWHKEGETDITSTESAMRFTNIQDNDAGSYVCDITNSCGTTTAGPVLVNVIASPSIIVQPQDIDVCTGNSLNISLSAEGDDLTFAWYRNNEYIGSNSQTYNASAADAQYEGSYYCKVESEHDCPTAYSDTITVTISTTPEITTHPNPTSITLCEGEEYGLGIRATGEGIHYQWYNNATALAGQTTDSLHISAITRDNNGIFYCIVSNACDEIQSVNVTATILRTPSDSITVIPPKCYGETAILTAFEDSLTMYDWNNGNGIIDTIFTNDASGEYRTFIHWEDGEQSHEVSLTSTNSDGCSSTGSVTIEEPGFPPEYSYRTISDTCALSRGGIEFILDTVDIASFIDIAFFWIDTTAGPYITDLDWGYEITMARDSLRVYNLPAGRYTYRIEYQTYNRDYIEIYRQYFGTYKCFDFPEFEVGTIGMIEADFTVDASVGELVAPNAEVLFRNSSNYDNINNMVCEWNFGDNVIERNCDEIVSHIYAEPGLYEPYLIVRIRDIPECRDTAYLNHGLFVECIIRSEIDTTVSNFVTIGDHTFYSTGNYTFSMPSETGCDTIYNIQLHVLAEPVYDIGPNPTSKMLNINSDGFISVVEFYSTTGQLVMRKEVNSYEANFDMEGLVDGVYILRIYGEESSLPSVSKIVKE